jgi:hypothetical protein
MSCQQRGNFLVLIAAILGLALAALAPPLLAQRVKDGQSSLDKLVFEKRELRVSKTLTDVDAVRERLANREDMRRFRSEYGAGWHFLIDRRTGRLNLLDGGAIPFIPGAANKLPPEAAKASPARVEALARDFLKRNRGVFQVDPEELVLNDPAGTVPVGSSMYLLRFQWVHGGVPVEGGSVFFAINNGNLIQVGLQNIGTIDLDPKPTVPVEKAWQVLKNYVGGMDAKDAVVNKGSLSILPVTPQGLDPETKVVPFGKMIGYVLTYRLAFQRPGVVGTWEGLVNAQTGDLLRFRDANVYGHIQGGVYKTDAPQTEVTMPFPLADYGAGTYADTSGNFAGVTGTGTLTGPATGSPGGVTMTDNCGAISLAANGTGLMDFGSGAGTDCTTPGVGGPGNTHAARTQYWNVTQIKMKGITYLPTNAWLQARLQDTVNINAVCNAYWDGVAVNFFKSGGGCANTGELPGVSLHEWGHGMDQNDGSGGTDNRPIETRADWTAILQTHQSCAGGGFFASGNCGGYGDPCLSCSGIRDADWAQHNSNTPWTPQNNLTVYQCFSGGYMGPCGWEDHCESGIAAQALWDLVNRDLVGPPTNLNVVTAWQLADRLFYTGMPQSTDMYTCTGTTTKTSDGCAAGSLYNVMRAIDDDGDGTANGTPHAAAIFAALARHGIACGAAADPANQNQTSCPALTTPALTGTANSHQVDLSWTTGGANATRYFVFRNETDCNAGFTKIATVNAPTTVYTDTAVVHGLTYYYRIQAATAVDSCVSEMSNCATVAAQLPPDQDFYVRDWTSTPLIFDNGAEPSTNSVFYYSSDVWNHGTNAAGVPNVNGWYDTDNMYAGAGPLGNNYAFVRVNRNASGSPASVTAHFLISPFGTGSSFVDADPLAVDPVLTFAPGDTFKVLSSGFLYNQNATASTHACLAVQISAPGDPYAPPGLFGQTPGPGDYIVIDDNNKAQRNLGVSVNVAHFAGIYYALIHNAALFPRDMVLRYETSAPERLRGAQIEVVGGRTMDFRSGGSLTLAKMQPGENRWIAWKLVVPGGDPIPVHFTEIDKDRAANGFTVLIQPAPLAAVVRDNLRSHVQVFNRLAAAFRIENAKLEAQAAEKLLQQREIKSSAYLGFLKRRAQGMSSVLTTLARQMKQGDAFNVLAALKDLGNDARAAKPEQSASHHSILLNRLDSYATMLQKAQGDPADIPQMIRWQESLYRTRPVLAKLDCSGDLVKRSQMLSKEYSQARPETYPVLLRALSPCYHQTAKALVNERLESAAAAMESPRLSLGALEKAHRELLLVLQEAAGPVQ